ncbi:MAG: membrane protein insertion efficiency factor YidD [Planctomycetes bacterium]|nr:membrane protein insertion efficiency factor YidD [Planctomycetota bacterium]
MLAKLIILFVRFYQMTLSPIIGHQCRFVPSCSQYFIEAVSKRGVVVGTLKGIWRILRCNPFSKGGYDPVD